MWGAYVWFVVFLVLCGLLAYAYLHDDDDDGFGW